jgi:hypothetical protein
MGSAPKNLNRYIKYYNSQQLDAMWMCPPNINQLEKLIFGLIFYSFNQKWLREYSRRFLDFLVTLEYDRPTIFHIFSGNCATFSHIIDLIVHDTVINANEQNLKSRLDILELKISHNRPSLRQ